MKPMMREGWPRNRAATRSMTPGVSMLVAGCMCVCVDVCVAMCGYGWGEGEIRG